MNVWRNERVVPFLLILGLLAGAGCKDDKTGTPKGDTTSQGGDEPGHSHERGKMLLADVGRKYHALLTAHLSSKDGNELSLKRCRSPG